MAENLFGSMGTGSSARGEFGVLPQGALPGLPRAVEAWPPSSPPPVPGIIALPASAVIFSTDLPGGTDLLDHASLVQPLAELLAHPATPMPVSAALLGTAGAGKSFALARLLEMVQARSVAAGIGTAASLAPLLLVPVNAAELAGEPGNALGLAICHSLVKSGNQGFADLARQALETGDDPHAAAEAAQEKLASSRLQLDAETRTLADMRARSARLAESLLNDPAGSPLDSYMRAKRQTIEARLRGFGFTRGEPQANYRDLVRDLHESGGSMPGLSSFFHALRGFRGQSRLLVWAILFAVLGVGFVVLQATKTSWMDSLLGWGPNFAPLASWLALHENWIGYARLACFAMAGLLLLRNFLRAWRFTRPLVHGLALLQTDVEAKRGALDTLLAQQGRRIETLAQDIQRLDRNAATAAQRAAASDPGPGHSAGLLASMAPAEAAPGLTFLAHLEALQKLPPAAGPANGPKRMIVAIDNLDGVASARAGEIMEAAARVLGGQKCAVIFAFDPKHVANVWPDAVARLDKLVQVPVQVGRNGLNGAQSSALVLNLLGHTGQARPTLPPNVDPARSMLDRPMTVTEAKLLTDLAPLAGRSARSVKRLVNLYRLARAPAPEAAAVAAFMLALDIGGTPAEVTALRNALNSTAPEAVFQTIDGGPRLAAAVQALRNASGGSLTGTTMMAGLASASPYMRR